VTSNGHSPEPNTDDGDSGAVDWDSIRGILGIAARLSFVACVCGVIIASLFGAPRLLYSYHVSHFAVLYVLTLTTLAAFPDCGILKAFWRLVGLVTVLGVVRVILRHELEINFLDWIADVSGILGGLAPVAVRRPREAQSGAS
jgi:hypothetical protein